MSTYGYIYATIATPDYHAQHFAILSFASNNRLGQVNFIHEVPDQLHGAKPILSGMLDNLHRGDTMVVTDLKKLGDTTVEVLAVLLTLSQRGVRLYVVGSGYRLDSNADALVVATACSLVSLVEKELVVAPEPAPVQIQMQRDDADTPTRRTRKSKLDGREEEIRSMLAEGASLSLIASTLKLTSRQSLSDFVLSRNLSVQNPPATT